MKTILKNTLLFTLLLSSQFVFAGAMGNMGGNMGMGNMGGMGMGMGGPGVPINNGLYVLLIAGLIYGLKVLYKNPKKEAVN